MDSVRNSNLGLCFFAFKCCVSQLSVDRFCKNFEGVRKLGQVKSSPNFCSFGPQRAEKRNIWRRKNTNLNLNSGLCTWIISSPIDGIVGPSPDYPVGEDLLLWCQFATYALSPLFFEVTSGEGEAEWPLSCVCALIHGFDNCIWNLTYFHCWKTQQTPGRRNCPEIIE